jgi:hypothetical protein
MAATRKQHSTKQTQAPARPKASARPKGAEVLYLAFELSWNEWKLAFATGPAENPRLKSVGGRDTLAGSCRWREPIRLPESALVRFGGDAGFMLVLEVLTVEGKSFFLVDRPHLVCFS